MRKSYFYEICLTNRMYDHFGRCKNYLIRVMLSNRMMKLMILLYMNRNL